MEAYELGFKIQRDVTKLIIKIAKASANEGGSTGQSALVRELAIYLNKLDLTDSTIAQSIENSFLDVYKRQGIAPFVYLSSGKITDKRIIDFTNTMIRQLPRNAVTTLNRLNNLAIRLANSKSITNEQALDIIINRPDFKGLTVSDAMGRNWKLSDVIKRNIRDQTKNSVRDSAEELGSYLGATVYEVSEHSGARPLCSIYQGKLISDGTREFVDYKGNTREVILTGTIESYEYGGGLFGNNCRHIKYPMVAGFSRPKNHDPLKEAALKIDAVEKKYK